MDEGVVERSVDVCNTENQLALRNLGAERYSVVFLGRLGLLGGLESVHPSIRRSIHLEESILRKTTVSIRRKDAYESVHTIFFVESRGLEEGEMSSVLTGINECLLSQCGHMYN